MSRNGHAVTCGYLAGGNTGLTKGQLDYIEKCKAARAAIAQHTVSKAKQQAKHIMKSDTYVFFEPK